MDQVKKSMQLLMAIVFSFFSTLASAVYIYEHSGVNWDTFYPDESTSYYDSTMSLSGYFTVADKLPGSLNYADISSLILDFEFNDGVYNYSPDTVDYSADGVFPSFAMKTDPSGSITGYVLVFTIGLFDDPDFVGEEFVVLNYADSSGSIAGLFRCDSLDSAGECNGDSRLNTAEITFDVVNNGWTESRLVPEPITLTLISLGLVGIGFARRRRQA